MAQYPVRINFDEVRKAKAAKAQPQNRPAKPITQKDLDRHARIQGEEAKESKIMQKKAKGGKCYAKGGSIDGVAKKGKTKGTMIKMARGGKTKGCK